MKNPLHTAYGLDAFRNDCLAEHLGYSNDPFQGRTTYHEFLDFAAQVDGRLQNPLYDCLYDVLHWKDIFRSSRSYGRAVGRR